MKQPMLCLSLVSLALLSPACGHGHSHDADGHEHGEGSHAHDEGDEDAGGHGDEHDGDAHDEDEHVEESLGWVRIGSFKVQLAQGHGPVAAGKEAHLVVKLPYSDDGETQVRAWIGTDDRLASYVGKGEYAAEHDDYDVHATAPDPLPADTRWWIELERPDGTKLLGSAEPLME